MHSTQQPKPTDDPHDVIVVAPDAVRVAPSDDEISDLLRAAARHHSGAQARNEPDPMAELSAPPVDTTFRPAAVDDLVRGRRRSMGRRALRAVAALLLAACIGGAAIAWQTFGYAGKKMMAKWVPQFALTTSLSLDKLGLRAEPAPPEAETEAADATSPQSPPLAPSASESTAAQSPDSAQSLRSMARDLANVGQEVEALKASIAELKASQQQMARELAKTSENKTSENKASEPNARARLSSAPPRPAVAPARKPTPPYSPTPTAAAPANRPTPSYSPTQATAAPAAPRQAEPLPQPAPQLPPEPGFASVPRPPMPVQ